MAVEEVVRKVLVDEHADLSPAVAA